MLVLFKTIIISWYQICYSEEQIMKWTDLFEEEKA